MKILVIGAAGTIERNRIAGDGGRGGETITAAHCAEIATPAPPSAAIAKPYIATKCISGRSELISPLASFVSGEAETGGEEICAIDRGGARIHFEAIRSEHAEAGGAYLPRVETGFGRPMRAHIEDEHVGAVA